MDSATTVAFLTPSRILIPKLLRSREGWKARAAARKKVNKALQIRVRDLTLSRNSWKTRALDAEQKLRDTDDQLAHTRQLLDAATAAAEILPKKILPT